MIAKLFGDITDQDRTNALKELSEHSTPSANFYLMMVLSILMATFGLLANSSAVVIGSMMIAPALYSMLSFSMAIVMADFSLLGKALTTTVKYVIYSIIASAVVTLLFSGGSHEYTNEILARIKPTLIYAGVSCVAGMAASFALVKPKLSEAFTGVAVSVALIPPLAVVGVGLAHLDTKIITGSLLLFGINVLGMMFASVVVFSLMNFYPKRKVAEKVVEKEEKAIEKEESKAEKNVS